MREPSWSKPVTAVGAQLDPLRARLCGERRIERRVLDHVRERLALFDLAREGEEHRPQRVFELRIRHHHVEDRLRVGRDRIPHTQRLEHAPSRGRDRRGAQIRPRTGRECRIGHHDAERIAEPLTQRERKREAGETAARDHHIGSHNLWPVKHGPSTNENARHAQSLM